MRARSAVLLLVPALALVACSDGGTDDLDASAGRDASGSDTGGRDAAVADASPADATPRDAALDAGTDAGTDGGTSRPEDCDPLQPELCSLPWPSNLYLAPDAARATGYTLTFGPTTLPANRSGAHVDPLPYQRMDGYGLGAPIMVLFPDLDFGASGLSDETNIAGSLEPNAPILLYRVAGTGLSRVPYYAELDSSEADPARRILFVRPAVILEEASRYVVAIRNLQDGSGTVYPPSEAFRALRASTTAGDPLLAPRQARFDELLGFLSGAGVDPDSLQLAWDFVTASPAALHGRLLAMRDDALQRTGEMGPALTITSTTEYVPTDDGSGRPIDPDLWYRVEGTMTVPSYLRVKSINFTSHTVLNLDADGVPQVNGTRSARFWINVPRSVASSTISHGLLIYGHGLLGSGDQALSGYNRRIANQYHYLYCGANLTGFSEDDTLTTASAVLDMSGFEWIADTTHQGLIEYLLLARAMRARFPSLPFFQRIGANIDPSRLYYEGISQGGIFGATVLAMSTDFTRGHLGVPGLNYSTLLYRSVDFAPFFEMMAQSYTDSRDRAVLLAAAQLLWDGTDPVSYYRHLAQDPLPGTPAHEVLLGPAKGDWQVAGITVEMLARTDVGIPLMEPYDDERTPYGIVQQPYPRAGSGIVLFDFGNPWPEPGNHPPMDDVGDPHGSPRNLPAHNAQMDHFLRTGEIIDVCGGDGCHPD